MTPPFLPNYGILDCHSRYSYTTTNRPAGNTTTICPYNKGEWYTVELTWDSATQKSDVTLNGENKGEFAFEKEGTPDRFELKVGDNSGTNLKAYFDDLALYEVTQ